MVDSRVTRIEFLEKDYRTESRQIKKKIRAQKGESPGSPILFGNGFQLPQPGPRASSLKGRLKALSGTQTNQHCHKGTTQAHWHGSQLWRN